MKIVRIYSDNLSKPQSFANTCHISAVWCQSQYARRSKAESFQVEGPYLEAARARSIDIVSSSFDFITCWVVHKYDNDIAFRQLPGSASARLTSCMKAHRHLLLHHNLLFLSGVRILACPPSLRLISCSDTTHYKHNNAICNCPYKSMNVNS